MVVWDVDVEAAEAKEPPRGLRLGTSSIVEPRYRAAKRQHFPVLSNTTPFQLRSYDSSIAFVTISLRASSKLDLQPPHFLLDEALILAICGAIALRSSGHELPLDPREWPSRVYHCSYTYCTCVWHKRMYGEQHQMPWADLPVQYAYSAWAPQFAQRLRLSKTESNLIVRAHRAPS